jgi:hypothetical protein
MRFLDFLSLIHTCVPRHLLNCFDTVVKFGRFSTKGDFRGFLASEYTFCASQET